MAITYDLANKYRPKTFADVVGNAAVLESLQALLDRKNGIPRAFLFHGPAGCGKTTLARIMAKALGCSDTDYYECNVGNQTGVDTVRKILEAVPYAPRMGSIKVYVLDECHKLTDAAQNALLKDLEEPPKHVFFMLCTTDPQKLLKTIKSRCAAATFQVEALRSKDMRQLLTGIIDAEGVDGFSDDVVNAIIANAEGSCRTALGLLDKVIDVVDVDQAIQLVDVLEKESIAIDELCKAMVNNAPWKTVQKILISLKEANVDAEEVRRRLLGWLTNAALKSSDPSRHAALIGIFSDNYYDIKFAGLVRDCADACPPK